MLTNVDNLVAKSCKKVAHKYHCVKCDYTTCRFSSWKKHINTKKHNATNVDKNADTLGKKLQKVANNKWICGCGKSYKHRQSFYRHKTKSTYISVEDETDSTDIIVHEKDNEAIVNKLMDIIIQQQQQQEITNKALNVLGEALKEEKAKNNNLTISGNNNNMNMNSNNTNFNIQLFLKEDCKNATSIQDFARQLKITMQDISLLKDNEPKAITNIITENLKDYTETERPFHHHKKKWYIKDKKQGWDNKGDAEGEKIVKNVKNGLSIKAPKIFVDNNPNFLNDEKQGTAYAETMVVAMKDVNKKDTTKVLKSLKPDCEL